MEKTFTKYANYLPHAATSHTILTILHATCNLTQTAVCRSISHTRGHNVLTTICQITLMMMLNMMMPMIGFICIQSKKKKKGKHACWNFN